MSDQELREAMRELLDKWTDIRRKLILMGYSDATADALTGRILSRSLGLPERAA